MTPCLFGFAQVTVTLAPPPAYQFHIENLLHVTLVNPTPTTYQVYMVGNATERKDGKIVDVTTTTFTLPPGTKVIHASDLAPLHVKESNSTYSDVVKRMGAVPSGDYDICVSVYNAADNSLLGEMCVQSEVQNLTQVDLLEPPDGTEFMLGIPDPSSQAQPLELKAMLNQIPEGYDARTALWALLNVLYPASPIEMEGDDSASRHQTSTDHIGHDHASRHQSPSTDSITQRPSKIKTEGDDIDWLPGIIVKDTNDCSGQGQIRHLQIVRGLKDPEGFLRTLGKVEDPVTLLNILARMPVTQESVRTEYITGARLPAGSENIRAVYRSGLEGQMEQSGFPQPLPGGIVTLSWLPPAPVPPGVRVTYTLRIAQSIGRQSPYDAIHANPATILLKNLPNNMIQLPLAARQLQSGNYAWTVQVFLNGTLMQESEVHHFVVSKSRPRDDYGNGGGGPRLDGPRRYNQLSPDNNTQTRFASTAPSLFGPEVRNTLTAHSSRLRKPVLYSSLSAEREWVFNPLVPPPVQPTQAAATSPFALVGSARFNGHFADRVGTYSEMPRNYLTSDLRPGLALYGLPFAGNFQYSTLQDASRQSINSFAINFDFESMRQGLESRLQQSIADAQNSAAHSVDQPKGLESPTLPTTAGASAISSLSPEQLESIATPSMLTDNLQRYSSINSAEQIFMSIRSLGIGTNYPSYSDYVLSGVPVTGVNLEVNPWIVYAAFTASQNQRPVDNTSYRRDLYAGRFGLGKKDGTHFFFHGLHVTDAATSIHLDSTNTTLTPRENYVFGMETKISMFDDHLSLEGEGNMSLFTRDTRDAAFASSSIPPVVVNMTNPRLSSSVDYMYTGRLAYSNIATSTRVSAAVKMVGPGYSSLGVPNLRSDQFGYEGKLDQQVWKNRITVGAFYRTYRDNLIAWKSSTSTMTAYGVNLGMNIPHVPYFRVSCSPITQTNNAADSLHIHGTNMLMLSAMTGYSYTVGSLNASTSFAYTSQTTETGDTAGRYASASYMLGEMVSIGSGLTLGVNLGFTESETVAGYGAMQTVELSGSAPLGEMITAGIGITAAFERSRDERIGFFANSTVRLSEWLDLDMRLEHTNYNEFMPLSGTYQEFIATGALMARW